VVRAIIGARVSVWTPGKTSVEEQSLIGEAYASTRGWEIAGNFEDIDVSAIDVDPWSRPDLAPWLTERLGEWDAIIFTKIDRAFRSIRDSVKFAEWAKDNRKILVFTDDSIALDYRESNGSGGYDQVMAELFLFLGAFFAQIEGRRFQQRALDAHRALRKTNRWSGGQPPYGYQVISNGEGGKILAIDPVSSEAVRYAAKLLTQNEGKSLWEIARALEEAGFPTPSRHVTNNQGPDSRSRRKTEVSDKWNQSSIGKILRSHACMGLKLTGRSIKARTITRDDNGLPIRMADPLFTEEEWATIQETLDARARTKERSHGASPLLGIAYCWGCKDRLYRVVNTTKGKKYAYIRCVPKAGKPKCEGCTFKDEEVMRNFEEAVAIDLRNVPVMARRFIPGEDHTHELDAIVKAMKDVREEKDLGLYDYPGGEDEYKQRLTSLAAARKTLSDLPYSPSKWVEEPTGETYAQAYFRMSPEERRTLIINAGIKFYVRPAGSPWEYALVTPDTATAGLQAFGFTWDEADQGDPTAVVPTPEFVELTIPES